MSKKKKIVWISKNELTVLPWPSTTAEYKSGFQLLFSTPCFPCPLAKQGTAVSPKHPQSSSADEELIIVTNYSLSQDASFILPESIYCCCPFLLFSHHTRSISNIIHSWRSSRLSNQRYFFFSSFKSQQKKANIIWYHLYVESFLKNDKNEIIY